MFPEIVDEGLPPEGSARDYTPNAGGGAVLALNTALSVPSEPREY
jgi:hypothetical protein